MSTDVLLYFFIAVFVLIILPMAKTFIWYILFAIPVKDIDSYIKCLLDNEDYNEFQKEKFTNQLLHDYTYNNISTPRKIKDRLKDLAQIYDLEKIVSLKEDLYRTKNIINNMDFDHLINKSRL